MKVLNILGFMRMMDEYVTEDNYHLVSANGIIVHVGVRYRG